MELLLKYQLSWMFLGLMTLLCVAIYALLQIGNEIMKHVHIDTKFEVWMDFFLTKGLLIFPFASSVFLLSIWVFVDTVWHGLIALFLIILNFQNIKNLSSGLIIKAANEIRRRSVIQIGNLKGEVIDMAVLGLYLFNNEGKVYISYRKILDEGYTIVHREDITGYCLVKVFLDTSQKIQPQISHLRNLLISAPYIDWTHPLQISQPLENEDHISVDVKIFLKEHHYKNRLLQSIQEWGYHCNTIL